MNRVLMSHDMNELWKWVLCPVLTSAVRSALLAAKDLRIFFGLIEKK